MKPNKLYNIGVVYIAFKEFGIDHFSNFIGSYRKYTSGIDHKLLIAFKGFSSKSEKFDYLNLLKDIEYSAIDVENKGYDIGTYLQIALDFKIEYYCFLNTKAVILAPGWLKILYFHASRHIVGAVSASGSFESLLTDYLRDRDATPSQRFSWRAVLRNSWINELRYRLYFPPFPNPHLRTNAFMMRREILLKIKHRDIRKKIDAARFENGRNNISQQVKGMGLEVLIVGCNGRAYPPEQWVASGTFWQGDQGNLLIADNQTMKYDLASPLEKKELTRKAWGF